METQQADQILGIEISTLARWYWREATLDKRLPCRGIMRAAVEGRVRSLDGSQKLELEVSGGLKRKSSRDAHCPLVILKIHPSVDI